MEQEIISWNFLLRAVASAMIFVPTAALIGLFGAWIYTRFVKAPKKKWDTFKSVLNNWDEAHGDWVSIKKDLSYVKVLIDLLKKFLGEPTLQTTSPISLTEKGVSIASTIDSHDIARKHLETINNSIKKDANPYEIQEACFTFAQNDLLKLLDEAKVDKIQAEAFEQGMELKEILKIIAVVIRDKILNKRGHEPKQIDEHSPKQ